MLEQITMWSAVCDGCKDVYEIYTQYSALALKQDVEEDLRESGEWVILEDERVFCPDCHTSFWHEVEDTLNAYTKHTIR